MTEIRSQRSEVRGRRAQVRIRRTQVRSRKAEGSEQKAGLQSWIEEAYSRGFAEHGDLNVTRECFAARVDAIISKRYRRSRDQDALTKFVAKLHLEDLYLATGCGQNNETSWERLKALYTNHISNVAHAFCSTHQEARDVKDEIITHLFFPDSQGRSRIATYDGLSSLRTWLGKIIKNRATYHHQLKWNEAVPLDSLRDTPSAAAADQLEAALLNARYGEALVDSFKVAANGLTDRERLVLLQLFEDGIPAGKVAKMFGVHQSQITRDARRAELKFRAIALNHLRTHHSLAQDALSECIAAIFRQPQTIAIALLDTIRPAAQRFAYAAA